MPTTTHAAETESALPKPDLSPHSDLSALSIFYKDEPQTLFADAPVLPPTLHGSMSPRKQALRRHEMNQQNELDRTILAQTKRNMKQRVSNSTSAGSDETTANGAFLFRKNIDGKTTLVTVPLSQIVVYHDNHEQSLAKQLLSGNVLARGILEIFQLHNGDVTYMSCGESFVYPLLPKLNLLRTTENSFVLPLANPRRYWKIVLGPADSSTIVKLETVLQSVVIYTNLVSNSTARPVDDPKAFEPRDSNQHLLSSMFSEIPPSPPLVSASPPPDVTSVPPFELPVPMQKHLRGSNGFQGFSPLQNELVYSPNLHAPLPQGQEFYGSSQQWQIANEPQFARNDRHHDKVESSSMDSLLDEYEETVSATRSVTHHDASSQILASPGAAYAFPSLNYRDHFDSPRKPTHDTRSIDHDWSHLNKSAGRLQPRRVDQSHGGRSRKSSTSELYTSVSSWMDPGQQGGGVIQHSKSIRSLASRQSLVTHNGLFDVYRQISSTAYPPTLSKANGSRKAKDSGGSQTRDALAKTEVPTGRRNDGLTPSEVYNLIRNRDNAVKPKSTGIRGFFGW